MKQNHYVRLGKKIGAMVLTAAIVFSGLTITAPMEAQAAAKPKKMTVKTSNKLLGTSKTIYVGGPKSYKTTKLVVSVTPAKASKKVKYVSSKPKVAKVSSKGVVTAKKKGTTYITVTSQANKKLKKKVKITVKKYVYPTSISVKAGAATLKQGASTTIKTTFKPNSASVKKVTYTSSNKALATVNSSGNVTANKTNKSGTVTITVKAQAKTKKNKALQKSVKITVKPRVEASSIKLDLTSKTLLKTGSQPNPTTTLKATVLPADAWNKSVTWTSSNPEVATVNSAGVVKAVATGTAVITAKTVNGKSTTCTITVKKSTSAVHDPSIFKDPKTGKYYTIGTALAMAVSNDLQAWSSAKSGTALLKNGLNELQPLFDFTGKKDLGNVWAADLIYNTSMKKYCMYVCAQNNTWTAAIGMLTADNVQGPYTYAGTIVCSDFTKNSIEKTNIRAALGLSSTAAIPTRYYNASESGTVNSAYYRANFPDAIDPAPYYDEKGNLYLTYGSFTSRGGICILKLDPKTGLRSTAYNYAYEKGVSDPYFGKIITNAVGEGPYIQQVPSTKSKTGYYYFLWTSSGALRGTGNYTMSMFRSEYPEGPFVDVKGTDAKNGGGIATMYNYKFSFMNYAYTSMGGNSAFVDSDGKIFIDYHNKFSDNSADPGTHMIKIHQMFLNEDGWLVAAPFEYHGETIASKYTTAQVAGSYEFIMHTQSTTEVYGNYNYNTSKALKLNTDGTVTGSLTGTWKLSGNYITITAGNVTYKGVVLEQYEDDGKNSSVSSGSKTMVFTALGNNNVNIWGAKVTATDSEATAYDSSKVSVDATAAADFTVPTMGLYGSDISWTSDQPNVISVTNGTAKVVGQLGDTQVNLTATIKRGASVVTKKFKVTVPSITIEIPTVITGNIDLPTEIGGNQVTWKTSDAATITTAGVVTRPATGVKTVTLTATIGGREIPTVVTVLPSTKSMKLEEDFTGKTVTTGNCTWQSASLSGGLSIQNDAAHGDHFVLTQDGSSGNRGAFGTFVNLGTLNATYCIEMDICLRSGNVANRSMSQFVIAGSNCDGKYNNNNGATTGYVLKLATPALATDGNTTTWYINDTNESIKLSADTWVHVTAIASTDTGVVSVKIASDKETLYNGSVNMKNPGTLSGIYIQSGRGNGVSKVDNIQIYE